MYEGVQPLVAYDVSPLPSPSAPLGARSPPSFHSQIAEEIVWAASRPDHVNIADVLVFPKAQAAAGVVHRGGYEKK